MLKEELLEHLYADYKIQFQGEEIVLGEGNPDAGLLLIGEAPGKDEVRLSRPFVGMAGRNLNEFLGVLGIQRQNIYITNAIKYRLSKINPQTGRVVNRPATKEEIDRNRDFLLKEIEIIKPAYVVTLGNVPLKAVTGEADISIGTVHGELKQSAAADREIHLFPLYHPASIIYNQSLKETYIDDIKKLKRIIEG